MQRSIFFLMTFSCSVFGRKLVDAVNMHSYLFLVLWYKPEFGKRLICEIF